MSQRQSWKSLILAALISGLTCYRIGVFMGGSTPWLSDVTLSQSTFSTKNTTSHSILGNDDDIVRGDWRSSRSSHSTNFTNFHPRQPTAPLPYPCGVVFFYHIPSTGGASINTWFRKYQKPQYGNISYWQHWALEVNKDGTHHKDPRGVEQKFDRGMREHIANLRPDEWRIAHAHLTSLHLNESEPWLYEWRDIVERQGCHMINTLMLRDPLNHGMSLYKIINSKSSTREVWNAHLSIPNATGLWASVLDFFLYNNMRGRRNPFGVGKEEKVRRALEILERHFDVVTLADHEEFMGRIYEMTNWTHIPMPRTNVHKGELIFTKKEVETLYKLLVGNGDIDFIDAVKRRYYGYLDYLER